MRIAITTPTTWPEVRRGGERFLNELAFYLARRGHEVTVISTKPGAPQITRERGYSTVRHRRLWHPLLGKFGIHGSHTFLLTAFFSLLRNHYDLVYCINFTDAYAAAMARRLTGVPCVLYLNSVPPPVRYERSATLGGGLFRRAVLHADEVIVPSRYMQDYFSQRFGRIGVQIPVPVDTETFRLSTARDQARPTILCASTLDDARKGGRLLMGAFDALKAIRPEARLQISSEVSDGTRAELIQLVSPNWRQDVHFLGVGRLEDLPRLFGQASISVLPSLWEGFGMVILESLATGTPVVGTLSGAIPELITSPDVGRLFDPGEPSGAEPTSVEGLTHAMLEALELSRRPETAHRCRAHAQRFSWAEIGPRLEALYERLRNRRRGSHFEMPGHQ